MSAQPPPQYPYPYPPQPPPQKEGSLWRMGKELIGLIILLTVGTCGVCLCMAGKAAHDAKTTTEARP